MSRVTAVPDISYEGSSGIAIIRQLQRELIQSIQAEQWGQVQHLDHICSLVVDRVIVANSHDKSTIICALNELKGVYANLIDRCSQVVDERVVCAQ